MSKESGFIQLRRGLWEHVRDGSLYPLAALIYIYMLTQADTRTGVWRGCAKSIATALHIPKRTAQYALKNLNGRYIRRFVIRGRNVCYPILLHRYCITQGTHVALMLDALNSTSERDLEFFKPENCSDVGTEVRTEVAPQRIKEKREERRKTPAPKPTAPADPRHRPFVDFAHAEFEQKHAQIPTWGGKDYKALSVMLASNKALGLDELKRRFRNFLDSTEPFIQKQGGSLAYFCTHVDSFLGGPILATPQKGGAANGKPSAIRTTLDGYHQLERAAGKVN